MSIKSLNIIHDEHRALAAMLSGLRAIASGIEAGRLKPDFDLIASMIEYIDKVPEKVHHPKEDQYLFAKLRLRSPEALPVIERLEEEHRQGETRINTLRAALAHYRQVGEAGLDALLTAPDAGLSAALDAFAAHAVAHFAQEDEWMRNTDFPAADCHIDEHAKVLASVREVQQALAEGDVAIVRELAVALQDWFPGHADYMDSALAQWMVKRSHGGAPLVFMRAARTRA